MFRYGKLATQSVATLLDQLRGHQQAPDRLRDFEADAQRQTERYGLLNRRVLGVRMVDVNLIVGSVGRAAEFNANFQLIINDGVERARLERVLKAMQAGEGLPPVELYRLRRDYYVLDGHHQVGAACLQGIEALEANVTLFIPSGDPEAVQLFHERRAFEHATGLQNIGGAHPVTYRRFLTEVHAYRRQLAEQEGQAIDLVYAARLWYARVFVPAFGALRGANLQSFYPMLRHADMLALLFAQERAVRRQQSGPAGEQAGPGPEEFSLR